MKGMNTLFIVLAISLLVASLWNSVPIIKDGVHAILDPSTGYLLNWNLNIGFIIIIILFVLLTTILQKYFTDQATLKRIKEEQKVVQEEMKKYREHPEKLMELQKKSMELISQSMPIAMRPAMFTSIPFILFFRWFGDYFADVDAKIFGIFSTQGVWLFPKWVWAYILSSIVISMILRKVMKVH